MQKIENIEIKNFKSIRQAEIKDCRRVNIFIGYPNVGKSNILEAMSLGSSFRNSNKFISFKDICRFEELIGLFYDGDKQKRIEIKINDLIYTLSLFDNTTIQYGVIHIDDFLESGFTEIGAFGKRLVINFDGKISDIGTNVSKKQSQVDIRKYQFGNQKFGNQNNPTKLHYPFGDNLFEVIRYNSELRKECGELFKDYDLKLAFDEDTKLKIQKQLDEFTVFQLPLMQVADTLQRLIFHKAAIAANQDTVLLFEEPEAHMFPPYIAKLTSDIIFDKNDNQYFIATHSPFVLNDFMEDMDKNDLSIYVVGLKDGETIVKRLTNEQITEVYQYGVDLFFNLEDYLKDAVS